MTDKFNKKTDTFRELKPCLEYIYNNFGREVFFSGRLSAYVLDLGPSIEEYSVIRFLEKENILNQIETIESLDINDRNLLLNDIIYKLPIHLNKDAFKSTLEIIILSLGVDLDGNKNTEIPETPSSEFEFDKNTGTIVKYLGTSKEIIIPEKIDGVPVKIIGDFAFTNMEIGKLTLPDGIEYIKGYAFAGNNIEIIDFPKSLKAIDEMAFSLNQIKKLKLSEGIEYIGDCAFAENKIDSFNLPNSLKYIGESAFFRFQ